MPENRFEASQARTSAAGRTTASPEQWATRVGVILAVAGSAVGLGNFLRFPGQAAQYGGGAFMIPYFCALIFLGIPIGWAEWAMGRYGGSKGFHSTPAIMGVFGGRPGRYLGVVGVVIPLVIAFYYILIESWCLAYCWYFVTGGIGIEVGDGIRQNEATSRDFFASVTGSKFNGVMFEGGVHQSLVFWSVVFLLNVVFVYRGLSGGIELFCRFAMPSMAVIALVVLVRVLTLGTPDANFPERNLESGLAFMWNPKFGKLMEFETWLAAAGQIFFSLSVGFGVIINYASYLKKRDDIVLSGLTASATNEFFEVGLGGMITIPAAVVFLGATGLATVGLGTFDLGFYTLPIVFAHMPFGNVFGALWFFMLFLAAITSSLSMLQPAKAFLQEALAVNRNVATTIVTIVVLSGSFFVIWYSEKLTALDTLDFWVGSVLIFIMAMIQMIYFSWVFGVERGVAEAEQGAQMRIPRVFRYIMKYVSPVYLLVIFGGFCWQNLPGRIDGVSKNYIAQYSLLLLLVVIVGLVVATIVGERRWLSRPAPVGEQAAVDYPVTHPDDQRP